MPQNSALPWYVSFFVFAVSTLFSSGPAQAQEITGASANQANPITRKLPLGKQAAATAQAGDEPGEESKNKKEMSEDGADEIRKRAEWFYKQRASVKGRIPAGARLRALQHMQRMMQAEGKISRLAESSNAENASSAASAASLPAWKPLGPGPTTGGDFSPVSGRVTTIAIDPSDASGNTVLIGGAQGGIWRTTDAGATWTPVGDQNASLSMGSIAFAPSNSSVVYAGTGEQEGIGFDIYYGAGVLKSSDHGQTWAQTCSVASATCPFIGPNDDVTPFGFFTLGGTRISYVAVNPDNPQMVLVGAQTEFGEGLAEGVYCSDNGGATWSHVLADEMSTFVGFASPTVAYAAFGNPYGSSPNAPTGNGIFKATAIGSTCATVKFTRLSAGTLPAQSSMGRIDIGIAASDSTGKTLYASIADASTASNTNLGVYFSSDGGNTWTQTAAPDVCQQQCWYDNVVKVDPLHAGTVFLGGAAVTDASGNPEWVMRSTNSGVTWSSVIPALPSGSAGVPHVDNHAMAFVKLPTGKVRMYLGNDGGMWRTDDAEAATIAWTNLNSASLTLTQFYPAISMHPSTPLFSIAGTQDNGTQIYSGTADWTDIGICGDGTGSVIDSLVPSSVYVACNGIFLGASYQNGAPGTYVPATNGINLADFSNFVPPFTADPNTADTLYLGTTKVYQSVDAANTWTPISNDLVSGGNFDSLTAIAVAPAAAQTVYAGGSSGAMFVATNVSAGNFANFNQLGASIIPPRAVTAIAIDPSDASGKTAYFAFSGFAFVNTSLGVNDPTGHIFKTQDRGNSWSDVSCSVAAPGNCAKPAAMDLPNIPVNDVVVDPDLPGTLYAATDLGVFVGNCTVAPCSWTTLSTGLPRAAVLSLRMYEPSRTLRAATHGRGAWDLQLNNFTFSGPHLAAITAPAAASANSGGAQFTLTVSGSGLTGGAIQFNGTALAATGTASDATLSGVVPGSLLTTGTAQITVKVASATSNALPFPILGGTPSITSITPSSTPVQVTPTTNVTIQMVGTNFTSNAKVLFNGAPNGITVLAPTSGCALPTCLRATLPAALMALYGSTNDITVLDPPPGGGESAAKTFRVVAPPPPNDNIANATNITSLTYFDAQDTSGATAESTDPVPPCVNQFSVTNGNTGGHPNGDYNTIWYKYTPIFSAGLTLDTSASSYDTVISVWSGTPGSLVNVACNDDITPGVDVQSTLSNVSLIAGTTYYIMISSFGPPDPNPVALGGRSFLRFYYNGGENPTPSISSLSPTSVNSGSLGLSLTVNGSGFLNGATVLIITSELFTPQPQPTTYVSSTQLTATIPGSAIALPGQASAFVENPQPTIGASNSLSFSVNLGTYPVPRVNNITPTSVLATTPGTVIEVGGDFFAPTAVLNFNGVAENTTVANPTALSAVIPASQLTTANVGTVQVTVSNPAPGGGPSASFPFSILMPNIVPTINSINPSSVQVNPPSPVTVTINGTNFQANSVILLNNFLEPTTFISSTQLSFLPNQYLNPPGVYQVYVEDPAPGGFSNSATFTVTGPPDFTIGTSGTTSVTIAAGTTATFTNAISVGALNSFSAAVSLTCAMPANATDTNCSITPNSLPTGNGMASVMVTTQARGFVTPLAPVRPVPVAYVISAILFVMLVYFWRFARTGRQRLALSLPMASVLLFLALQIVGCGGGGSITPPPPPPPPTGTPAGTYTITVTATSGNLTHNTTLTLIVQ